MPIEADDRAQLVRLARAAVEASVTGSMLPRVEALKGLLGEKRGCFVTLTNRGSLRGCIGTFQPDRPLGELIVHMGAAAAHDSRFALNPITASELPHLKVEVSVLSPLRETAEPDKLEIGKHGIYIVRGRWAGCFLPEVATDMGWSAEEFLSQCCAGKAGLPADAWKQEGTTVYLFTSEKFDS
ncbi:MAG: AmmeMemoRadiSam system protein A [Phycisphaerae bacterium]|jgi:AmmeMemoRadiSam system protein A